jgi:putative DNA primase/helicase
MSESYIAEKQSLREFLERRGIEHNDKNWKCINHDDQHPSAVIYNNADGHLFYCPVCSESWNVFAVASMLDNIPNTKEDFPKLLKAVRDTLGIPMPEKKSITKTEKPIEEPVCLSRDEAKNVYTRERIMEIFKFSKHSKLDMDKAFIAGSWAYDNGECDIIKGMDIRFEDGSGAKDVVTFWYNGKSLKTAMAPVLIYNLHECINSNKPIIINEGAKKGEAAKVLEQFTASAWSGGWGKAKYADWTPLQNKEIYIFPDDDAPGIKATQEIRRKIIHAKIVNPPLAARKIKPKGADIVEALRVMSTDELTAYILNPENHLKDIEKSPESGRGGLPALQQGKKDGRPPRPDSGDSSMPFKILGIGDDGRAAFITEEGRAMEWTLDSISKNKLVVLCGQAYWLTEYPGKKGPDWDAAIDDIIRISQNKDFDKSDVRGRGAWKDGDKISYNDGVKVYGEHAKKKIYLRLRQKDIGINDAPAEKELLDNIKNTVFRMSFETPADAVRCLGWSVLAPFGGALEYRPALFLTGESGTGKTQVANLIIKKISACEWFNGSGTTSAGIRGKVKYNSEAIVLDEFEADTPKKKLDREDILTFMRVNVSNDAPDTVKGTKDGGFNSFKMQNIFGFIAKDPTVESEADENRIFRVNMVEPKNSDEWDEIKNKIEELLCEENCRKIRALTWQKLKIIIPLVKRIAKSIRKNIRKDYRFGYLDSLLAAAFIVVWQGVDDPTDQQIEEMILKYYEYQPHEEKRNEAEEIIDRLLDQTIEIIHEHTREKLTIFECLTRIYTGRKIHGESKEDVPPIEKDNYKLACARYGIRLTPEYEIAICNNHHEIKIIIQRANGYSKIFKRHPGCIDSNRNISFYDGKQKKCSVFKELIKNQLTEDEQKEIPF